MSINSENDKVYKSRVNYQNIGGDDSKISAQPSSSQDRSEFEQEEIKLFDKRAKIVKRIISVIVIIGALYYLVYGAIQYNKARKQHSVKTWIDGTQTNLTVPISMACQPIVIPNTSWTQIEGYVVDSTPIKPDEMKLIDVWDQILTFNEWQRLLFSIDNFKTINVTNPLNITYIMVDYQCEMIIPPKNTVFKSEIVQSWLYYAEGMDSSNPYLEQYFDVNLPNFLVREFQFKLMQRTAHFDEILHQAQQNIGSSKITMGDIVATMFDYGNELYGTPWSAVPIELALSTHSYLTDHGLYVTLQDVNKYSVTQYGVLKVVGGAQEAYRANTSLVYFILSPKTTGGSVKIRNQSFSYPEVIFYHEYNEEYLEYSFPDLLSGIGGFAHLIVGLCATISGMLLGGFVVYKYKFKGYAPYPSLDSKTKEQITRLVHKIMEQESQNQQQTQIQNQ